MDGVSLLPTMRRPKNRPDRVLQLEAPHPLFAGPIPVNPWDRPYKGVRTDRYTYVFWTETGEEELYDLQADPNQLTNLANDPTYGSVKAGLAAKLALLEKCAGPLVPGEAIERNGGAKPPNIMLLITDQQRAPRHWPDEPGWLEELMPNDTELSRTGLTFKRGFTNTAMCSPSRATLFTGRFPREHGVELTLTAADLHPNPKNTGHVISTMGGIIRRREAPARRVLTQFTKGLFRIGHSRGNETPLPKDVPNIATLLRAAGYHVALKGKWHLTHPQSSRRPARGMGREGRPPDRGGLRVC